jgi:hypothetical protein
MGMSESEGRAVLKDRFEAAGLEIDEDQRLTGEGYDFVADGYDAARRVGYEYVTTEAGDRVELPPAAIAALERDMAAGKLVLLLVDERDVAGEDDLAAAAERFLAELRARGWLT